MSVLREHGTSWKDVREGGLYGVIVFILFLALEAWLGESTRTRPIAGMNYLTFGLLVSVSLPALAVLTMLVRIRVTEHFVQHFVAGVLISEHRREDLQELKRATGFFSIVLKFSDGSRISTFTCHRAASRLAADLPWIRQGTGSTA